ncbi:MAG: hypothetical protein ACT4OY_07325 [Alphaproteobacteria bacterium]
MQDNFNPIQFVDGLLEAMTKVSSQGLDEALLAEQIATSYRYNLNEGKPYQAYLILHCLRNAPSLQSSLKPSDIEKLYDLCLESEHEDLAADILFDLDQDNPLLTNLKNRAIFSEIMEMGRRPCVRFGEQTYDYQAAVLYDKGREPDSPGKTYIISNQLIFTPFDLRNIFKNTKDKEGHVYKITCALERQFQRVAGSTITPEWQKRLAALGSNELDVDFQQS